MTRPFPALFAILLAVAPRVAAAQASPAPLDSSRLSSVDRDASAALVQPLPVGIPTKAPCQAPFACARPYGPAPVQDVSKTRGRYALIGFIVGAGAGASIYLRACASEDCYSLFPAVLLGAAGGLLGMVVGLLIAPA